MIGCGEDRYQASGRVVRKGVYVQCGAGGADVRRGSERAGGGAGYHLKKEIMIDVRVRVAAFGSLWRVHYFGKFTVMRMLRRGPCRTNDS